MPSAPVRPAAGMNGLTGYHRARDNKPLQQAIKKAGGIRALARAIGIKHQAILQWKKVPPLRVLEVEACTGVRRERLRPDHLPPADPTEETIRIFDYPPWPLSTIYRG